jgi:hypothetical protein
MDRDEYYVQYIGSMYVFTKYKYYRTTNVSSVEDGFKSNVE